MEKRYQVFVSSTKEDLEEERQEITKALLESNCIPAGMELFPAADESSWKIIKKTIEESDYYLLVIGGRYGTVPKNSKKSYTEMEFDYAKSINKPILAFIHPDTSQLIAAKVEKTGKGQNKLKSFVKKVKENRNVMFWRNKTELISGIKTSIASAVATTPTSGWIRGDVVGISPNAMHQLDSINNVVTAWGLERIFKTRAEKNAESDVLLEKHNIAHLDGIAFGLRSFRNTREKDVLQCLCNGMQMRLLVMNPYSSFVEQRAIEENSMPNKIADSILDLLEWVNKLNKECAAKSGKGRIDVKLYSAMTLDFYWRIDDCLYVGPYWFGVDSQQTITYKFKNGGRGFTLYSYYFEDLWNNDELAKTPDVVK